MARKRNKRRVHANKKASQRAYEASSNGRRLGQWDAPALSPTQAVVTELDLLRKRARATIRNNPWVSRALTVDVASEIGTGITPRAVTLDQDFNKEMMEVYEDYVPFADASGFLSVYGIQALAIRTRKESGEAFIRIIRKRSDSSLPIPLQFQVLESDFCPLWLNKDIGDGNKIISGVEVNKYGKPVAYWIYPHHPDDGGVLFENLIRIPTKDMIHHFIPKRPGQLRGEPQGTQSAVRAYVYDKYDDAELGRKESRASFTGVVRRPDYGEADYKFDPISGQPIEKDGKDVPIIDMEAGTFPNLLPGEDITLFDGDDAGKGYKDFQWHQMLGISAGWGVPYALVTGDYTQINDRIWRAIMNQYHREVEQVQDLYIIAQICRRMWNEIVNRAILVGAVKAPTGMTSNFSHLRAVHRPQAWKHIHPVQDVQSKIMEIDAGLTSRQKTIDEGKDESIEEIDRQRSEDYKRELDLGLKQEQEETNSNNSNDNKDKNNESTKKTK